MALDRLYASKKSSEISDSACTPENLISAEGKRKKPKFEEKYQRLTTYIEYTLFLKLQEKRENGDIENVTIFFNKAIKEALEEME